jgi:hypothetical protein
MLVAGYWKAAQYKRKAPIDEWAPGSTSAGALVRRLDRKLALRLSETAGAANTGAGPD